MSHGSNSSKATCINVNFYDTRIDNDMDVDNIAKQLAQRTDYEMRRRGVPNFG
jgi:hypothetical protein